MVYVGTYIHTCVYVLRCFSCDQLLVTPWTVACQAPLSMGFFRQKYWTRLPFPSPGNLSNPGIKPMSLASPAPLADSLPSEPPGEPHIHTDNGILLCRNNETLPFVTTWMDPEGIMLSEVNQSQKHRYHRT